MILVKIFVYVPHGSLVKISDKEKQHVRFALLTEEVFC